MQTLGLTEDVDNYEEIGEGTPIAEKVAKKTDYTKNQEWLGRIQIAVYSISMVATSVTNSGPHFKKLGMVGAIALAAALALVVEGLYLTLRHGQRTVYQGFQRKAAKLCYHIIQVTMILNVSLICTWIIGNEPPHILLVWNHWSIVIHWAIALFGATTVSDLDWIVAARMSQLKAATNVEAIKTAASSGTAIVVGAAKLRGYLEAIKRAYQILRGKEQGDDQSLPATY